MSAFHSASLGGGNAISLPPRLPGHSMKNFAITLFAAVLGLLIALFIYDRFVLAPRITEATAAPALGEARNEAKAISEELNASVKKTVDDARKAMSDQATEADRRRLAAEALGRSMTFKVAITEYYQNSLTWPKKAKDIGLEEPRAYAGGAIEGVELGEQGAILVNFNDTFMPPSRVRLTPRANASGMVEWRCVVEGSDELRRYLLSCKG